MDDVDVGLFDRDWYNTLYFFILNADEQIYMRYGGRDAASPDTYLNMDSLTLAAQQGIELHQRYLKGELPRKPRPKPMFSVSSLSNMRRWLSATMRLPIRIMITCWP